MPPDFTSPATGRFVLSGLWLMVYGIILFTYLWLYQAYPANIGTKAIEQAAMLKKSLSLTRLACRFSNQRSISGLGCAALLGN